MAYVDTPTTHIGGYLYYAGASTPVQSDTLQTVGADTAWLAANTDGTHGFMIIPTLTFATQLSEAEGHTSTGEFHEIAAALVEALYQSYNSMATADKPSTLTITRSALVDTATAGQSKRTWSITGTLDTSGLDVVTPS